MLGADLCPILSPLLIYCLLAFVVAFLWRREETLIGPLIYKSGCKVSPSFHPIYVYSIPLSHPPLHVVSSSFDVGFLWTSTIAASH